MGRRRPTAGPSRCTCARASPGPTARRSPSADVLFTLQAVFDPKTESVVAEQLTVDGKPITARRARRSHGRPLLSGALRPGPAAARRAVILPKHKLEGALQGRDVRQRLELGHAAGGHRRHRPVHAARVRPRPAPCPRPQSRATGARRPTARQLPYLDRIVLQVVPDQDAELLRLQSGDIDMTQSELRPDDYVAAKRAEDQGKLKVVELGVGADADAFWFDLKPGGVEERPALCLRQQARVPPGDLVCGRSRSVRAKTSSSAPRFPSGDRLRRATRSGSRRTCCATRTT